MPLSCSFFPWFEPETFLVTRTHVVRKITFSQLFLTRFVESISEQQHVLSYVSYKKKKKSV